MEKFILGVDISTTAAKVVAWSSSGANLGTGRCDIPLNTPAPGIYEQDPVHWWGAFITAISELSKILDVGNAIALAISNQRETVAFLTNNADSVAPAIVWLDERARDEVDEFAEKIGADKIHRITGKHKDITPVVYRLAWMRKHEPKICSDIQVISDVQGFLVKRLTGVFKTSWASADPMGCWNITDKCWSNEILSELGWSDSIFPHAEKPGTPLGEINAEAASQTGLPQGILVIAGGGDGQCAGLAMGVVSASTAYVNIGTAVVCGAHHSKYVYGDAWRTMTSMSGDGYIMESCLRSGTFLLNWLVGEIFAGKNGGEFDALESQAASLPAGSDGVRVLPYWSGAMNPHWDTSARGAIFGLGGSHGRAHLYRAVMEGIALDQADCMRMIERDTGVSVKQYYVVGGGAQSDMWCQIFADCFDRLVCRTDTIEASALGAGMVAAAGAGLFPSILQSCKNMCGKITASFEPGCNAGEYKHLLNAYTELYPAAKSVAMSTAST